MLLPRMNPETSLMQKVQNRIRAYASTPDCVREKRLLGLRRAFGPVLSLPMWVTTTSGAQLFLGKEELDESILYHLTIEVVERYFPDGLQLQAGDVVLDVGGHHGFYAMEALARFPGTRVICIEPDPIGIAIIEKHIRRNGVETRVDLLPFAVGSEETVGFLTDNDDGSWGKTLESDENEKSVQVRVRRLRDTFNDEWNRIKVVKSNCEGGEFTLVPQMIELGIKPELIILMIHPERGDPRTLIESLERYGYRASVVYDSPTHPCWHFWLTE